MANPKNKIKIKSLSPALSKNLCAGKDIMIEVKIKYTMQESSGIVGLIIQNGKGPVFDHEPSLVELKQQMFRTLINVTRPVFKGSDEIVLKAFFRVPEDAVALSVFTSLLIEGVDSTETTDSTCYKVKSPHGRK